MAKLSLTERALLFYGTRLPQTPSQGGGFNDRLRRSLGVAIDRDVEVVRDHLRWSLNPANYGHESLFWLGSKDPWEIHHLSPASPAGERDLGRRRQLRLLRSISRQSARTALPGPRPRAQPVQLRPAFFGTSPGTTFGDIVKAYRLGVSDHSETVSMSEADGKLWPRRQSCRAARSPASHSRLWISFARRGSSTALTS